MLENPPANVGDTGDSGRSLAWEGLLEEEMATHSSILAWEIPRTEEPGELWSMGRKEPDTIEHTHQLAFLGLPWWLRW